VALGQGDGLAAALDTGADGDDPLNTRLRCPGEDGVDFSLKFGKIEVGVGVDQHER